MKHNILNFPCNACCVDANNTMLNEYELLKNENDKLKMNLLIASIFLIGSQYMQKRKNKNIIELIKETIKEKKEFKVYFDDRHTCVDF